MNLELKSTAYAIISRGIHIYIPDDSKNYVLASRLVCAECNEPWYMNLSQCFLCGAINPFLYRCDSCRTFISITNAGKKCNTCGKQNTLHLECPNPKCLSNKNKEISKEINRLGGVFNKNSGFLISLQHCLNCGSQLHRYQTKRIIVSTINSKKFEKNKIKIEDPTELTNESYILFRLVSNSEKVRYAFMKLTKFRKCSEIVELSKLYENIDEVLKEMFK
jgi:hypothetical protein